MQDLSEQTHQACHLAIASDDRMVVVARVEAPGDLGFSVRVGYQRHLVKSTSGIVLYAFQAPKRRDSWRHSLRAGVTADEWRHFEAKAEEAQGQGYVTNKSSYTEGITDIACPVRNETSVIASLTMPFIKTSESVGIDEAVMRLKATAIVLSRALGG
jgi:DNA-binding IclR family transcriptional regulator